jgi:VanZ family protein
VIVTITVPMEQVKTSNEAADGCQVWMQFIRGIMWICLSRKHSSMIWRKPMLGLLPTAIGNAAIGDQPYYPMGRAVMGGLMFSTIGAMIVLPLVYTAFEDLRTWGRGIVAKIRQPA